MLELIAASDYATLAAIVYVDTDPSASSPTLPRLYSAYARLDHALFRPRPDAFARTDASALLRGIPEHHSDSTGSADASPTTVSATPRSLKGANLDVLVNLAPHRSSDAVTKCAPFGVWTLHPSDTRTIRGAPEGFWEVVERRHPTGATLVITGAPGDGVALDRTISQTDIVSISRNRNQLHWKAVSLIPRNLERLRRLGAARFFADARVPGIGLEFYSSRRYRTPTNSALLAVLAKHGARYLGKRLEHMFCRHQWMLLYHFGEGPSTQMCRFRPLRPPNDRFWADPHVLERAGYYYVYIEEYPYAAGKGHISVLVMDQSGVVAPPITVITEPYHLSYPFVFEWNGAEWMILDSNAKRSIDLYRCERFPDRWVHHKSIMKDVVALDSTLLHYDGKWWLFTILVEHEGAAAYDELFLFYADSPVADYWHRHPDSPIVSDARRARPAGRIFEHRGELVRPAQDCGPRYGYGLRFHRIQELSVSAYAETEIATAEPRWHSRIKAVHTFAYTGHLTMIDAAWQRPRHLLMPARTTSTRPAHEC